MSRTRERECGENNQLRTRRRATANIPARARAVIVNPDGVAGGGLGSDRLGEATVGGLEVGPRLAIKLLRRRQAVEEWPQIAVGKALVEASVLLFVQNTGSPPRSRKTSRTASSSSLGTHAPGHPIQRKRSLSGDRAECGRQAARALARIPFGSAFFERHRQARRGDDKLGRVHCLLMSYWARSYQPDAAGVAGNPGDRCDSR